MRNASTQSSDALDAHDPGDPRTELADLKEQIQIASARHQLHALKTALGVPIREDHGDFVAESTSGRRLLEDSGGYGTFGGGLVDTSGYIYDDPNFGFASPAGIYSTLSDRQYGRFSPVYRNETDLMRIRGSVQNLTLLAPTVDAIMDGLANYVLGEGFTFEVHEAPDAQSLGDFASLVSAVQRVVDEFTDDHGFDGTGLDREAHFRSRKEGEAFIPVEWSQRKRRAKCRFLECEQIAQPFGTVDLDNWLGVDQESQSDWTFGVHTIHRRTNEVLGYHVIYDGINSEFSYFPDEIVPDAMTQDARQEGTGPVGRLQHIKRNVTANAKRGVSDIFGCLGDLAREAKLRRNTAEGAALQAAIAWIIQAPAGTTQGQMDNIGTGDFFTQYNRPVSGGGTKTQSVNRYPPGTVLKPSFGLEYKPGPMGAERNQGFIEVGQYVLRMIGARWQMPEAMVSGDSSNANYASALVAEAPFVKGREADQRFYKRHFQNLIWKVIRMSWEMGRFDRFGISWATLEHLVDVKIDCPAVATRDELELVQTQQLEVALGTLSRHTAAAERGRDLEAEEKLGAKPEAAIANPPGSEAMPGGLRKAMKPGEAGQPQPGQPVQPTQQPRQGAAANPNQPQQPGGRGNPQGPHGAQSGLQHGRQQSRLRESKRIGGATGAALREAVATAETVEEARALVIDATAYP